MDDSIRTAASNFSISIDEWQEFFKGKVRKESKLVPAYLKFIEQLGELGLPPIFEGKHLQKLLGVSGFEFLRLTETTESNYRTFSIPKRTGGQRQISVPSPLLLYCQRWITSFILSKIEIHPSAHGYVVGRSNLTNARTHLGSRQILKMDISDFFGSVRLAKIVDVFYCAGYPPNVAYLLGKICCANGVLPQGAASSPMLSNIILRGIDAEIELFVSKIGLKYSRYVDDITISGDHISADYLNIVDNIFDRIGLNINRKKTKIQKGRKKIVTGVSIGTGETKLPRNMKREFHNNAFLALKRGLLLNEEGNPLFLEKVIGQINYWSSLEPDNFKVKSMLQDLKDMKLKS